MNPIPPSESAKLVPISKMARMIGVADSTFRLWYDKRIVPGELNNSKKPRFDPDKVLAALRDYARQNPDQPWHSKIPMFAGE